MSPQLPPPFYPDKRPLQRTDTSPYEIRRSLETLLETFAVSPDERANASILQKTTTMSGIIGAILGYAPMGILYGPIGAGIGAVLGSLSGLKLGDLGVEFSNRPRAALAATERGDFTKAIRLYRDCIKDLEKGATESLALYHLHRFFERPADVPASLLKAAYYAACALLEHAQGMRIMALEDYSKSLSFRPANLAVLQSYIGLMDPQDPREVDLALEALRSAISYLERTTWEMERNLWWWDSELIGIYELWARVNPRDTSNLRRLANSYAELGQSDHGLERALQTLRVISWLEPDDVYVQQAIRKLQSRLDMLDIKEDMRQVRADLAAFVDRITELTSRVRKEWLQDLRQDSSGFVGYRTAEPRIVIEEDGDATWQTAESAAPLAYDDRRLQVFEDRLHSALINEIEREHHIPDIRRIQDRLTGQYDGFSYLSLRAQDFLSVAEFLWELLENMTGPDYSPVSVEYAKTLESEMRALIAGFAEHLENDGKLRRFLEPLLFKNSMGSGRAPRNGSWSEDDRQAARSYHMLARAVRAIISQDDEIPGSGRNHYGLTIVQIARMLSFPQSDKMPGALLIWFKEYIRGLPGARLYLDPQFHLEFLEQRVGHRYRNGAAHTEHLGKDVVEEFRIELLEKPGFLWQVARGRQV